mmetsp:Transcript_25669/g.67348  ORF Transcript_25669/g.67348 Transcript_25669/m.67348 type:complete len:203 (-) Transcript_25669:828-1436(-)
MKDAQMTYSSTSLLIQRLQEFCNRRKLDIRCSLIYCTDLRISIKFFRGVILDESNAAHPFNALRRRRLRHTGGLELCHGCFLFKGHPGLFHPGGIVNHEPSTFNFQSSFCVLELHPLEVAYFGTELFSLKEIRHCSIKTSLSKTNHLSPDPNSPLVQNANCVLVPVAVLAENVLGRYLDIRKPHRACAAAANPELILRIPDF